MIFPVRPWTWCASLVWAVAALGAAAAFCRAAEPAGVQSPARQPYRKLAPGVLQSVDPQLRESETVSRHDLVELLAVAPDLDWAKARTFRRQIWYLDLKFKPMRMILVDIPQPDGLMRQKLIWYLVYSVTNPGKVMPTVEAADGTLQLQDSEKEVPLILEFQLASHEFGKAYPHRVIPAAMGPIQMREDPARKFLTPVEMASRQIKPGETVWGVVTWEDVDPRIDRFSVYVNGLTNAYRWEDTPGAFQPGDPIGKGRKFLRKTLKLNFWRPGDEYYEHEKEFRFGIPGEVDYEWVYR